MELPLSYVKMEKISIILEVASIYFQAGFE